MVQFKMLLIIFRILFIGGNESFELSLETNRQAVQFF